MIGNNNFKSLGNNTFKSLGNKQSKEITEVRYGFNIHSLTQKSEGEEVN